jgi:hypothetical protein
MKKIKLLSAVLALVMAFAMSASAVDTLSYEFDNDFVGDPADFTSMGTFWSQTLPAVGTCHVVEVEGGKALELSGFCELKTTDVITGEYVFGFDVKTNDATASAEMVGHGIFLRSVMPEHFMKNNNHSGEGDWPMHLYYYESDWYGVWGGTDGAQGIGGSGIYASLDDEGLMLTVKSFTEDAMNVSSKPTVIPYPDGVYYDEFFNLTFFDNGVDKVDIYINNQPFATFELSEPGVVYDVDANTAEDAYFGKAVLKDAYGTELATFENTRISSKSSQLAFGTRGGKIEVDNIKVITGEGAVESVKGDLPAPETKDPTATQKPAEDTKAPAESGATTDAAGTNAATGTDTTAGDKTDAEGTNTGLIIGIVVAVVAVIAVAVVVVMKKKK